MSDEEIGKPKDPVVLDAEGHVVHDPFRDSAEHRKPQFRAVTFSSVGLVPKILLGAAFVALLLLGLTVAGVALGVIFVGFLVRTIFRPRRR
jgi:hypothetical protein